MPFARPVNIIGAGLAGTLLAIMLARRGHTVIVRERRKDPRVTSEERGRSINLALAARGIRALEHAGVMRRVRELIIPMRGRMLHELSGNVSLLPYGQREDEVIYSIGRAALNRLLIEEAARYPGVSLHFGQTCIAALPQTGQLRFRDGGPAAGVSGALASAATEYEVPMSPAIATDGAGSMVRHSLVAGGYLETRDEWLDHDYKELTLPAITGEPALDPNALHIWPRGAYMLIALPNTDGSFTATLFLPRTGADSFASLDGAERIERFFQAQFADVVPLIPNLIEQFRAHPAGALGTVRVNAWQVAGQVLLLGDAAHAIVPFHGQGMNAAFEDCWTLDSLLDRGTWEAIFTEFERVRRPDAQAIAQMALENYTEMRATVLDPAFLRRKRLALELERRFPERFIPRYSMVMFHPEISYSEALRRGRVQEQILMQLDVDTSDFDPVLAERLVHAQLPPVQR